MSDSANTIKSIKSLLKDTYSFKDPIKKEEKKFNKIKDLLKSKKKINIFDKKLPKI